MVLQVKDGWHVYYCDNKKCDMYKELVMLDDSWGLPPCNDCGK